MNTQELQTALLKHGYDLGKWGADGVAGRDTMKAVDGFLEKHSQKVKQGFERWTDARKRIAAEQLHFLLESYEIGDVDGLVGPQTEYIRELFKNPSLKYWRDNQPKLPLITPAKAPKNNWPTYANAAKFFGPPGSGHTSLKMPYPMVVAWDPDSIVNKVTCHSKIAPSLERIFTRTLDHYKMDGIRKLRLDRYGGCYNNRKMRGGNSLSTHAYAAAFDLDPERNQFKWGRDKATLDAKEYEAFWSFVEDEAMVSLGRRFNYDWMHFQAIIQ